MSGEEEEEKKKKKDRHQQTPPTRRCLSQRLQQEGDARIQWGGSGRGGTRVARCSDPPAKGKVRTSVRKQV